MRISKLWALVAALAAACSNSVTPSSDSPAGGNSGSVDPPAVIEPDMARYRAAFQATWSAETHPIDFPSNPHFSPLVGGTHTSSVTFWRDGGLATPGIRNMAERGLTSTLSQEVADAISRGTAEQTILGGSIGTSPGTASAEFVVSQSFPLVTLVSMIAPSPDWFVGVSSVALYRNGRWVEQLQFDLVPWDAGTDSGLTFASLDLVTAPPQPIAPIVSVPLSPGGRVTPLGSLTFTRLPL